MDLERLDEALKDADYRLEQASSISPPYHDEPLYSLTVAARAYRDLANGERVEWCEVHRSACHLPNPLTEERCDVWVAAQLDGWDVAESCRVVSRLLVDPPADTRRTEEER